MARPNADAARNKKILDLLDTLGKGQVGEDSFTYSADDKFVIPGRYRENPKDGVTTLAKLVEAEEKKFTVSRTFNYRPWDGAAAFARALKRVFGVSGIGQSQFDMFGNEYPPELISIPTGPNGETEQVPWGEFAMPVLDAMFSLGGQRDRENGVIFALSATAPRRMRNKLEGFFEVVKEELRTESIYRGKAFFGTGDEDMPTFLDPFKLDPSSVVYSDDVHRQLLGSVWAPIRHREALKAEGRTLKRAVLLAGDYGTGKSLAGNLTAREALENGWTFIHVRPGRDNVLDALRTARLYQPSVVLVEDVDSESNRGSDLRELLEAFDGITAKGNDVIVVATTNHPDKIHPGMLRPGRMDAVVTFEGLDRAGVEALFRHVAGDRLAVEIDWNAVHAVTGGFPPAYLKEVANRAVLYQVAAGNPSVETDDLVYAAKGLADQLELQRRNAEPLEIKSLDEELQRLVQEAVPEAMRHTVLTDAAGDGRYGFDRIREDAAIVKALEKRAKVNPATDNPA